MNINLSIHDWMNEWWSLSKSIFHIFKTDVQRISCLQTKEILWFGFVNIIFFVCVCVIWTQDFGFIKQAFYCLSYTTSPFCSVFFFCWDFEMWSLELFDQTGLELQSSQSQISASQVEFRPEPLHLAIISS
jgi:hypothetical protein